MTSLLTNIQQRLRFGDAIEQLSSSLNLVLFFELLGLNKNYKTGFDTMNTSLQQLNAMQK